MRLKREQNRIQYILNEVYIMSLVSLVNLKVQHFNRTFVTIIHKFNDFEIQLLDYIVI